MENTFCQTGSLAPGLNVQHGDIAAGVSQEPPPQVSPGTKAASQAESGADCVSCTSIFDGHLVGSDQSLRTQFLDDMMNSCMASTPVIEESSSGQ